MYQERLQRSITRHKDDVTFLELNLSLPLQYQLDAQMCSILSGDLEDSFQPWEHRQANLSLKDTLPNTPGLYMFVWQPEMGFKIEGKDERQFFNWVLYVGIAEDSIKKRYTSYRKFIQKDPERLWKIKEATHRNKKLEKYFSIKPIQFWYCSIEPQRAATEREHDSLVEFLRRFETKLIKFFNPPVNTQHSLKLGKTKPAWGGE